jgi:hypothetical protein
LHSLDSFALDLVCFPSFTFGTGSCLNIKSFQLEQNVSWKRRRSGVTTYFGRNLLLLINLDNLFLLSRIFNNLCFYIETKLESTANIFEKGIKNVWLKTCLFPQNQPPSNKCFKITLSQHFQIFTVRFNIICGDVKG